MAYPSCELGIVGLGVMGRNLALNVAARAIPVVGYDLDRAATAALVAAAAGGPAHGAATLRDLVAALRKPRAVLLLVPAGEPVDATLDALTPALEPGDVIADGGNSHFRDTERRAARLAPASIHYLGLGISGGEAGARHGPSLMAGGPDVAWQRLRPVLEAIAARVDDESCVARLGTGASGHYVKMVHNGIEYGLMQLIAEVYDVFRRAGGLDAAAARAIFAAWAEGELGSYLLEITARILAHRDERTGGPLIDVIADAARQKGTGRWTLQEARRLHVPVPAIDAGVTMRDLSGDDEGRDLLRDRLAEPLAQPEPVVGEAFVARLAGALQAATITTFAQGFALLRRASREHDFGLDLATVARIWRGGCIIRARVLDDICAAYAADRDLPHLLADPPLLRKVNARQPALREAILTAVRAGIPVPGLIGCLGYLDAYRGPRLPANLVQAQRDYFGAHTYRRIDDDEIHHTAWETPA